MALNYLLRAMQMIEKVGEVRNADTLELCAKTKLNVAALYSELRRYPEAVEYAEQCLATLQLELNLRLSGRKMEELRDKDRLKFLNMISTYVVAFYNIGVSEESQGHGINAVEAYRNAVSIGKRYLPSSSPVLVLAQTALNETPQEVQTQSDLKSIPKEAEKDMLEDRRKDAHTTVDEPEEVHDTSSRFLSPLSSNNVSAIRKNSVEVAPREPSQKLRDDQYKYYTPEQLIKLQQRLSKGTGLNFVSADKYFYTKITKTLNVSQDVKFLRPLSA
jgi:tetratricopeptide (TPR) repeat protein